MGGNGYDMHRRHLEITRYDPEPLQQIGNTPDAESIEGDGRSIGAASQLLVGPHMSHYSNEGQVPARETRSQGQTWRFLSPGRSFCIRTRRHIGPDSWLSPDARSEALDLLQATKGLSSTEHVARLI